MNPEAYYVNHHDETSTQDLDFAFLDDNEFVPIDSAPVFHFPESYNEDTDQTETSFNFANISSTHLTPSPKICQREQSLTSEIQLYINLLPEAYKQCK